MNAPTALTAPALYRSEAFAEDLQGLSPGLQPVPAPKPRRAASTWLLLCAPLLLAVAGAVVSVAAALS